MWIGIPRKVVMDKATLFGNLGIDNNRKIVEQKLQLTCHLLTLRKGCAD